MGRGANQINFGSTLTRASAYDGRQNFDFLMEDTCTALRRTPPQFQRQPPGLRPTMRGVIRQHRTPLNTRRAAPVTSLRHRSALTSWVKRPVNPKSLSTELVALNTCTNHKAILYVPKERATDRADEGRGGSLTQKRRTNDLGSGQLVLHSHRGASILWSAMRTTAGAGAAGSQPGYCGVTGCAWDDQADFRFRAPTCR